MVVSIPWQRLTRKIVGLGFSKVIDCPHAISFEKKTKDL